MTPAAAQSTDLLAINTIRFLAVDMVEKAKSGHPGAPLGHGADGLPALDAASCASIPTDPAWPDRDRFVLSCGHASALLYALLHLAGYDLPLEELQRFRQLGSRTPGHPEHGHTPGVETTTGPLGQGVAQRGRHGDRPARSSRRASTATAAALRLPDLGARRATAT